MKYCSRHENIKVISSSHRAISLYYIVSMKKAVNDVSDIFTSEDMENIPLVIF